MSKKRLSALMDEELIEAIRRYARTHGNLTFTSALAILAARGLAAEGIHLGQPEWLPPKEAS